MFPSFLLKDFVHLLRKPGKQPYVSLASEGNVTRKSLIGSHTTLKNIKLFKMYLSWDRRWLYKAVETVIGSYKNPGI